MRAFAGALAIVALAQGPTPAAKADAVVQQLKAGYPMIACARKSLPAEYNTPGHVAHDVVDDIASWIKAAKSK